MGEIDVFAGLNDAQRAAVAMVRGPVCIVAGAGSGKTTTITRRLAYQVLSGAFSPSALLAVTFTDKAAGEMRSRLALLGVGGVRARTFHAAALGQLNYFRPGSVGEILAGKGKVLGPIVRSLGRPHRFVPVADFASEIEWAKNQRITTDRYLASLGEHRPPVNPEVMHEVFREYERRKNRAGAIDFEDMLERTVRMFEDDDSVAAVFRDRYLALTVDEYQDVNLLQQSLLECWLGDRDDLCVVGDDYQAIYSFTGASPRFLLEMPKRHPATRVVKLVHNYRSGTQVLEVANRLVPRLGGMAKELHATRPAGPKPVIKGFPSGRTERAYIVDRVKELDSEGVAYEEIAILYRTNARSEDHAEALHEAGIPHQVRDDPFLSRPAARQLLPQLVRLTTTAVAEAVRAGAAQLGYEPEARSNLGAQEFVRQKDLARLIRLAEAYEDGRSTVGEFVAELRRRFAQEAQPQGVNLMTLHRAKGLEFDAVFIPSVEKNEIPHRRAPADEERRLFYVGITRAKRFLHITWTTENNQQASTFIGEVKGAARLAEAPLKAARRAGPQPDGIRARIGLEVGLPGGHEGPILEIDEEGALVDVGGGAKVVVRFGEIVRTDTGVRPLIGAGDLSRSGLAGGEVASALKAWRKQRATTDGVPAFVVMHDSTLDEIARVRPSSLAALRTVSGMGPVKCDRYGDEILAAVSASGGEARSRGEGGGPGQPAEGL